MAKDSFKNLFKINYWDHIFIYNGLLATANFLCFHPALQLRLGWEPWLRFAWASDATSGVGGGNWAALTFGLGQLFLKQQARCEEAGVEGKQACGLQ